MGLQPEAVRKAQGACHAHILEDTGNHHHDRIDLGKNTFYSVGLDKRAQSLCSGRSPVVSSNTAFPMSRAA
jgi:hypothetical protein